MMNRKVQCWIFSRPSTLEKARCLLLQTNVARGEFWQPVTGSVEPSETFAAAALREAQEETALSFNTPPQDTGYEFEFTSRFGLACERVYALTVDEEASPCLDPNEHQNFQWLSPTDALRLLKFPSNIEGLKRAYRLVFGTELRDNR